MQYIVKWRAKERPKEIKSSPSTYPNPSQAIDFASAVLDSQPVDVWIEDVSGQQIPGAAKIIIANAAEIKARLTACGRRS